ncbi:NIPA-like protein [Podospora conica]|nr:NIPA-like protein [Schizothecium conicum]
MNSSTVKRKFNALLQGISNGNPNADADTPNRPASSASDSAAQPSSQSSRLPPREATASTRALLGPESSPARTTPSIFSSPASTIRMTGNNSDLEYLTKKRRVAGPPSTPSKYGDVAASSPARFTGGGGPTTTISNITLRKWTPSGSPVAPPSTRGDGTSELKYCPGDRDQLLRRLATFQELTDWTPKPERVSEVEWAKRGWTCTGKERVRCALCGRELAVGVNRKEVDGREISVLIASEVAEGVVAKYAELIVDGHGEDCLWRKKGCDDSLLRLPLSQPRLALTSLRQRYDDLVSRDAFLPYAFNLRLPPTLDLDAILGYLPATFFSDPPPPTTTNTAKVNRPALALALLGWQGLTNPRLDAPVPNSASCHTCLRRLGLWMFKSREVDPETNEVLVPAPMDHLDPLREHRFFCPWKNGGAQRNPGAGAKAEEPPAGWEVLVQVLRNESLVRQRVGAVTPGHGRSKSSVPAPSSARTEGGGRRPGTATAEEGEGDGERKDKDVMSRLRRVKSLFNSKAGGRLRRLSRPGTAGSTGGGE